MNNCTLNIILFVIGILFIIYLIIRIVDPELVMSGEAYTLKYTNREYKKHKKCKKCGSKNNYKLFISPSYTLDSCDYYLIKCKDCNHKSKKYINNY